MGDRVEWGSGRVLGTEHCVAVPREGEKVRERESRERERERETESEHQIGERRQTPS